MDARHFDQLRLDLLQRRADGRIAKSEYDEMLAELARLEQRANSPSPAPSYVPDVAAREEETVAAIPIPPRLHPGVRFDKYELKSSKRGGMGEVWKAWDVKAERWTAVKLLPTELRGSEAEIARIRRQFGLVEKLDHPAICRLFDLNEHPVWGWYEVMRWIDGRTLTELCANAGGKLRLPRVVELLSPAAEALDFAHSQNVLHRDVKPQNMMVDEAGRLYVIDFGLAAEVRSSLSRLSRRVDSLDGTPHYLAPELWNGAAASPKSDQYALAVTAYELRAGRKPFESDDLAILMARVRTAEVPAIGGVSDEAMAVLRRALAKSPEDRYATCGEFVRALGSPPPDAAAPPPPQHKADPPPHPRATAPPPTADEPPAPRSSAPPPPDPAPPPPEPTAAESPSEQRPAWYRSFFNGFTGAKDEDRRPEPAKVRQRQPPASLNAPFSQEAAREAQRAWAEHLGREVYEKNDLGMEFVLIPPGTFKMGRAKLVIYPKQKSLFGPSVTLTRPFWLGRNVVMQQEWAEIMGMSPQAVERLAGRKKSRPASGVSWIEATEGCRRLTKRARGSWKYRLPTEAEWEWGCFAGSVLESWPPSNLGDLLKRPHSVRNASTEVDSNRVATVENGAEHEFGLYEPPQTVFEWCADVYQSVLRGGEDPEVTAGGENRVIRCFRFMTNHRGGPRTFRHCLAPTDNNAALGLRLAAIPANY